MSNQPPTNPDLDPSITTAWQSSGVAERYKAAENATRPFAAIMVDLSERVTTLTSTPVHVFDLACGTGAVEAELYAAVSRAQWDDLDILAGDISVPMLEYLDARGKKEGWTGLKTRVVDGMKLESSNVGVEGGFGHVFVGFAVFVLPEDTVRKLAREVRPGGTLAISTWAHLPWYELLKKTYAKIEDGPQVPSTTSLWSAITDGKAWYDAQFVRKQLEDAGLKKVEVVQKKVNVNCGTPDVFMTTMGFVLGMLSKQWPEEKREKWEREVKETMKGVLVEEAGANQSVLMDFEGIVAVGLKGE